MGATRPASVFSAASGRVAPISACIFAVRFRQRPPNVLSKKSILNTQPCGSVFEFAPTDNRHEVTVIGVCALHVFSPSVPCGSPSV